MKSTQTPFIFGFYASVCKQRFTPRGITHSLGVNLITKCHDRFCHRHSGKGLAKVDVYPLVAKRRYAKYLFGEFAKQGLRQVH